MSSRSLLANVRNFKWVYEDTQLVAHIPSFTEMKKESVLKQAAKFKGKAPVAAFDLFSLVNMTECSFHPKIWNWNSSALHGLNTLTEKGYIVVVLSNKWKWYAGEKGNGFPAFNSLSELMLRINRSYRNSVSAGGVFVYAMPKELQKNPLMVSSKSPQMDSSKKPHQGVRKHDIRTWNAFKTTLQSSLPADVHVDYTQSFFVGNSTEHRRFAEEAGLKYADNLPHFEENGVPKFSKVSTETGSNPLKSKAKEETREQKFEWIWV